MSDTDTNDTPDETLPLTDTANGGTQGQTTVAEPDEDAAKADPNDTNVIQKVNKDQTDTIALPVADPGQVKAAALSSPAFVTQATTEAPVSNDPIKASDGPAAKADHDAMIDRALVLVKRHFGASDFKIKDDGSVSLVDSTGKEVGSGKLEDLLKEAKDALPPGEKVPDLQVTAAPTHSINNLDDLQNGLRSAGVDTDVSKEGDHYLITSTHTDLEGKQTQHAGYVTVNAKKDELTKFFMTVIKEIGKEVKDLEAKIKAL